jgi:mannose-1-phosphate guanylyltransferase/mannose-1-phosphate guanylyltransferase/mannose-6-phosphate isomerase
LLGHKQNPKLQNALERQKLSGAAPPHARRITPVILSGGSGSRLWPLSRKQRPKQMLALAGERSMLELTAARVADPERYAEPIVVTAAGHALDVEACFEQAGMPLHRLILEPEGRNTAPAIALAALTADPADLLLVMPSDHLIKDEASFQQAVDEARPSAEAGRLVTFGIRPTRAETGYGYIKRGEQIAAGTYKVDEFVEKPAAPAAAEFVRGGYDWNAGIFLFRADAYLAALRTHAPDIFVGTIAAVGIADDQRTIRPDPALFREIRAQSIDRAVMEHEPNVAVVTMDAGWSDVGTWQALHQVSDHDSGDNTVGGEVVALDVKGSLIRTEGPMIVAIGVENLAIVATGDVVLVMPLSESQRVSEAVALLTSRSDPRL